MMQADDRDERLLNFGDRSAADFGTEDLCRRKSFISTSVVSEDASIEQSKEWINTYLDGNGGKEDDFQRKFQEGGQKIDNTSPGTMAREILKEEMNEGLHTTGEKIIETYEQVLTTPMLQASGRKFTLDNIPCVECDENESHLKFHRLSVPGKVTKPDEAYEKAETEKEVISEKDSLPAKEALTEESSNIPILLPNAGSSKIEKPATSLSKTRSKSKKKENSPLEIFPQIEVQSAPDYPPVYKVDTKIKIKIFDLSLVRERYMNKTHDEVRSKFLKTLQVKQKMPGVFSPKPPVKEQKSRRLSNSVIIFDWDDTLFCTSFLSSLNHTRKSELGTKEKLLFKKVDESACLLLKTSCEYAIPYIITNAAQGWVEYSSQVFMPMTHKVLKMKKVHIISARSNYEGMYPMDTSKWKLEAFFAIGKTYSDKNQTNIICLGDSDIEMEAAKMLGKQLNSTYIKTVKFEEFPTPLELIKQHKLVTDKFVEIFYCFKSKMIKLEKRKK